MTDTHTHPYLPEFDSDGGAADFFRRAEQAGVSRFILPNVDLSSVGPMLEACSGRANVFPATGLHPTEVFENWEEQLRLILERSEGCRPVAIGEVGIDLYWDATHRDLQMQAFERQTRLAAQMQLPVIVHCREGLSEALEVIEGVGRGVQFIFHSFTGDRDDVERIRRVTDAMFGINGVVTFKNAPALREALPEIGADRILLETDAPYLAPVPHRGRRNESAWLPDICRCVAAGLGMTAEETERVTDESATRIFSLDRH